MPVPKVASGFTALDLYRDADAIALNVSQDTARSMDVVDVTLSLKLTLNQRAASYDMSVTVPEGLRLAADTFAK